MNLSKFVHHRSTAVPIEINLHTKTARSRGETEQRIYELMAWREAPFYTERERAALAWAEAVTLRFYRSRAGRCLRGNARTVY